MNTIGYSYVKAAEFPTHGDSFGGTIEQWYASWGTRGPRVSRILLAHLRVARPTTRLWLDTLMPIALITALTHGAVPLRVAGLTALAMNLLHLAATLLNDVKDVETDRLSSEILRRRRPIASGLISPRTALVEAVACAIVGLGVTVLVRWQLTAVTVVLALLITQHELPPLRTQSRPIMSQIAGLTGLVGIVTALVAAAGQLPSGPVYFYLLFVIVYLGVGEMLVKDIRDYDNDRQGGKLTTAVKYGPAAATAVASIAYGVAALGWVWFAACGPVAASPGWLYAGAVILVAWVLLTVISAVQLRSSFDKAIARRLHRGSALVFSLTCVALLASYVL
ncbi:UbiA family prenyltransferase [Mycobacterium sp.]|uniref:UbiA family prenyltransferase n=1 Tax=Mycobacterium sp. TaxID=1785 RepID=UPI0031D8A492